MLLKIICLKDLSYGYILAFLNLQVELSSPATCEGHEHSDPRSGPTL